MTKSEYMTICEMNKDEAIYYAEQDIADLEDNPHATDGHMAKAQLELKAIKDAPLEDFYSFNACVSPKESTELY
jgi:hypothetical protein